VNRVDLERIDAMSVGPHGDVYLSQFRPGAVKRVDLTTGKVELVLQPAESESAGLTTGPTALAMATRTGRLLFANLWGPRLFSMDIASRQVATVADLKVLAQAPAPVGVGISAVAAADDAIYFADTWRVFRIGPSGGPEVVAGGGRGY
jgi:sugar lactone lactonase YvrE